MLISQYEYAYMNVLQFLTEGIRLALKAIGTNRMRAFLTMLGVGTGIFAITSILTMVNSLKVSLTEGIAALGNTVLFVHHWPWAEGGEEWYKFINRPMVSYSDYQDLKQRLTHVDGVCLEATARGQTVRAEGRSLSNIELGGVTHDKVVIGEMAFSEGRYFSEIESHLGSAVCFVGDNIAKELFPDGDALNNTLRVQGKRLRIVGIMERKGAGLFPGMPSEDDRVYVPYKVLAGMFNLNKRGIEKVIQIKATSHEDLPYVEEEVIGIMRASRGLKPATENNFAINKQEALMERFEQFFGVLATGGWWISIFSILIGGFSIANIMYISVRERTREIGVQKALGSTRSFILFQFLMEAVLICLIGGLLGLWAVALLAFLAS
ncbi:MAG: ABC transporter permease, partial [Bacteroidetes bacterium]